MKKLFAIVFFLSCFHSAWAHDIFSSALKTPKTTELYRGKIKDIPGKEVIISMVELPPGAKSPKHTHPGEEYAFVIEGEAIQMIGQNAEETVRPGKVAPIPYGQPHYVRTDKGPLRAIVFRIHDAGKPERELVK